MGLFNKLKRAFLGEEEEKVTEDIESAEDVEPAEDQEAIEDNGEVEEVEELEASVESDDEDQNVDTEATTEEAEVVEIEDEQAKEDIEPEESVLEPVEDEVQTEEQDEPHETEEETIEDDNNDAQEVEEDVEEQEETSDETEEELVVDEKYNQGLEKTRKTFGERLNELFANFRHVDEDFFEELEDTLITSDVGFDTAMKLSDELRQEVKLKNAKKPKDLQHVIIQKLVDIYEHAGEAKDETLHFNQDGLTVILFVGVNGAGKTTTVGKLAHQLKNEGRHVLLAAADTFRAGAIDQLVEWGKRAEVDVVRGQEGGDPASVVYDAMTKAKEENADVLLVDTAGRLQNKVNLMNELAKIKRVIQRELPEAPQEVLLVLDATTGQNALSQAKQFNDTTDVTGLVLTKLDGTAKGGIVLAIRNELNIPVKLVGLGEKIDDLAPFDAEQFAYGLFKGLWSE